jgi:hypothetical protein
MSTSLDEAKGILEDECGICPKCHDHKPCGCVMSMGDHLRKHIHAKISDSLPEEDFPYECPVCGLRSNSKEKLINDGRCFNCDSPLDLEEE